MGVMLVKQVRRREARRHVSHSQPFNSLNWFGKRKSQQNKINTLSVQYILCCVSERPCIHSDLLTHIVLVSHLVSVL